MKPHLNPLDMDLYFDPHKMAKLHIRLLNIYIFPLKIHELFYGKSVKMSPC